MQKTASVLLLAPARDAVSGVSTHLNHLLASSLAKEFRLVHFQVGSEGRQESKLARAWRIFSGPLHFSRCLFTEDISIVHVNTSLLPKSFWRDLAFVLIGRLSGKKIVYQIHGGLVPDEFWRKYGVPRWLLTYALRLPNRIVVLWDERLDAFRKFSPSLCLSTIPNAVELGADPVWKREQVNHSRPLKLAFIGRLSVEKGVFDIIDAMVILRDAGIRVEVSFAGVGPAEDQLRDAVHSRGLGNAVTFEGVVRGVDKTRLLEAADLFVLPSYREGLPYALLESMAARTPPLVSPVGAVPRIIDNGRHGMHVPVRNPGELAKVIQKLHHERHLISQMGELCRQVVVGQFSLDRLAADFRETYIGLIAEGLTTPQQSPGENG